MSAKDEIKPEVKDEPKPVASTNITTQS
jgi:hypothetical protein